MKSYDELKALIEARGVHPEFGDAGAGWGIEQNPHELATFLVRMQELGVASVLEIGTGYKGGLSRFLAADMGWDVTTVDIKNYGHAFKGVHYVIGDKSLFTRRFDLVFIDGNHSFESVQKDYESYAAYVQKVVAFHDIVGLRACEGAKWFWEEYTKPTSSPHSIIDHSERAAGIGWIEL